MKEDILLYRLKKKDPRALEWVMEKYTPYLSRVVWNILGQTMSASDAEEVVADVFVTLWQHPENIQQGKLKAWLAAVGRNTAMHKLRTLGKELPLEENWLEVSDGSTPYDQLAQEAQRKAIRQALEDMGEPDCEIFLRHYYYIQGIREIAREMGMKESTVKSRLHRGRLRLKETLMEWGAV